MKRKTILLLTLLSIGQCIYAQHFKFGLQAGLDITKSYLIDLPEEITENLTISPMISYNINGYIAYKGNSFLGLSIEPGFIKKGRNQNDGVKYHFNYIQLPILAEIYLTDKLFLSVGPELGYLINVKVKSEDAPDYKNDLYDKKFELSGLIGINYSIIENFDIGLRYSRSLTSTSDRIWTNEYGEKGEESKEYNQYIQVLVRFKI